MAGESYEFSAANLAFGVAASPFSRSYAARTIARSGAFAPGDFLPVVTAVIAGLSAFRIALRTTTEAIERGSRLYQEAARTARRPGQLALLQNVLSGIGIDPNTTQRLLLQAQSIRGPGSAQNIFGNVLRMAQGAGDTGTAQQIRNMRPEIEDLANKMERASRIMGETAGSMQRLSQEGLVLQTNFHAAIERIVMDNENAITGLLKLAGALVRFGEIMAKVERIALLPFTYGLELIGRLTKSKTAGLGPDNQLFPGGTVHPLVSSMWQRLGLSFGNFGGVNYAQQTAQNTKRIADAVAGKAGSNFLTPFAAPAPGFHIP